MLTVIEFAGSAVVAFIYLAILTTAVNTRKKPGAPQAKEKPAPAKSVRTDPSYDSAIN